MPTRITERFTIRQVADASIPVTISLSLIVDDSDLLKPARQHVCLLQ
jgi:hypothetical protein